MTFTSQEASSLAGALSVANEAIDLLNGMQAQTKSAKLAQNSAATIIEHCRSLCEEHTVGKTEPVRLVHHFSCTGGTMISRCIASMPNIQLLSEIDPLSTALDTSTKPRFAPTDIITLLRGGTRGTDPQFIVELFLNDINAIHAYTTGIGQRLVLRNHAHSHYCTGELVSDRLSLQQMIATRFATKSVLTVRHPLDSFLSLLANAWVTFSPPSLDEYSKRYLAFLRAHAGVPVMQYESFADEPDNFMLQLCKTLSIPFNAYYKSLYDAFELTGASGRGGGDIHRRDRRAIDDATQAERKISRYYEELCFTMNYPEP